MLLLLLVDDDDDDDDIVMFCCSICNRGFTQIGTGPSLQCLSTPTFRPTNMPSFPPSNYISQIPGPITPVPGTLLLNTTLPVEYFLQFQINIRSVNNWHNAFSVSYGFPFEFASGEPSVYTCPVRHTFVYYLQDKI